VDINILAICAHPDDAELTCAGLLLHAKVRGSTIGVVDLTQGEMGSRGTAEDRVNEAANAAEILGLDLRLNLEFPDGNIRVDKENIIRIIDVIRRYRPKILIAPYWEDHHPDHEATSRLVKNAWWFSGVAKHPGQGSPHRSERILYYLARFPFQPSLVIDISDYWEIKKKAILCYHTQLHNSHDELPETYTSTPDFIDEWEGRHRYLGSLIGVKYGEAYYMRSPVPVFNPHSLLGDLPGIL
jgi:N-acetylglucosamine malate deacetylase 1